MAEVEEEQKPPAPIYKHSKRFHIPQREELENSAGWDQLSDRAKKRRLQFALDSNGEQATVDLTDLEHYTAVSRKYALTTQYKNSIAKKTANPPPISYLRGEDTVDFSGNDEPEDPQAQSDILLLTLACWNNGGHYDLGMITSDMRFRHMVFAFPQIFAVNLTVGAEKLFSRIFQQYHLTPKTKILFESSVNRSCPLVLYLQLAKRYVGFDVEVRPYPQAISRLMTAYHSMAPRSFKPGTRQMSCKLTRYNVQRYADIALEYFVAGGQCPWITQAVYEKLQKMSVRSKRRAMRPYLMLFYMAISARRSQATLKSQARRLAKQAAQQQNFSTQTDSGENSENET